MEVELVAQGSLAERGPGRGCGPGRDFPSSYQGGYARGRKGRS